MKRIGDIEKGDVIVSNQSGNEWDIIKVDQEIVYFWDRENKTLCFDHFSNILKLFSIKQPEEQWPQIGDTVIAINSMLDTHEQPWTGSAKQKRKLEAGFIQSSMVAADIAIKRIKEAIGR